MAGVNDEREEPRNAQAGLAFDISVLHPAPSHLRLPSSPAALLAFRRCGFADSPSFLSTGNRTSLFLYLLQKPKALWFRAFWLIDLFRASSPLQIIMSDQVISALRRTDMESQSLESAGNTSTANTVAAGNSAAAADVNDRFFLSTFDNPVLPLVTVQFTGDNFHSWRNNMKMALDAEQKFGFVDGSYEKPAKGTVDYDRWVKCDHMVRCWLYDSISAEIREIFDYCSSAKQLWEEIIARYGETKGALIYQVKKEKSNLIQGNDSITLFFNRMKRLWEEIRRLDPIPECLCGGVQNSCTCGLLKKLVEREQRDNLVEFLMGLNEGYRHVRNTILAMEPLPNINEAFCMIQQIERQQTNIKAAGMEGEAKWIVCTEKTIPSLRYGAYDRGYLEFYTVASGSLEKDVLPPLYTSYGLMCMVRMEGSIYIIGGTNVDDKPEPNTDPKNLVNYTGACRLSSDGARWEQIEVPFRKAISITRTCAPLEGKLYCFGCSDLFPEVFDPQHGTWTQLHGKGPGSILGKGQPLNRPVLPHCSRILVHSSDCGLWAYNPPTTTAQGTWEHLASGFYNWSNAVAAVDNVIYVHDLATRRVFRAYDLDTSKWLDVVWSSKRCADYDVKFTRVNFGALAYLGDGVFELAAWVPRTPRNKHVTLYFLKFKSDYDRATSALHLTPLTSHLHHLMENDIAVRHFIPPPPN